MRPQHPTSVNGPVIHRYGQFRLRTRGLILSDGTIVRLPGYLITMVVERASEVEITSMQSQSSELPTVIQTLQLWLQNEQRQLEVMEAHIAELQRPELLSELQAHLDRTNREETLTNTQESSVEGMPMRERAEDVLDTERKLLQQRRLRLTQVRHAYNELARS